MVARGHLAIGIEVDPTERKVRDILNFLSCMNMIYLPYGNRANSRQNRWVVCSRRMLGGVVSKPSDTRLQREL